MLILKPSTVHGVGVFTDRAIKKGESITSWFADDCRFYKTLPKGAIEYLCYEVSGGWYGPSDFKQISQGWYVNHSDKPNILTTSNETFRAARNIKKGAELTIDYGQLS